MFVKFYRCKVLLTFVILTGILLGCEKMVSKFNERRNKVEKQMLMEVCSPPPSMVDSLLLEAAKQGKTTTVKVMLANGANINTKSKIELTALMYAASNGHIDIVKILLNQGANVNEKNKDGETALMLAEVNQYNKIIELIKKADIK